MQRYIKYGIYPNLYSIFTIYKKKKKHKEKGPLLLILLLIYAPLVAQSVVLICMICAFSSCP